MNSVPKKLLKIVSATSASKASLSVCSKYPKELNENSSILLIFISILLQGLSTRNNNNKKENPYVFLSLSPKPVHFKLYQWILEGVTHPGYLRIAWQATFGFSIFHNSIFFRFLFKAARQRNASEQVQCLCVNSWAIKNKE